MGDLSGAKLVACKYLDSENTPIYPAIIPTGGAPARNFNLQNIESRKFTADRKNPIFVDKSAGYSKVAPLAENPRGSSSGVHNILMVYSPT